ncbi:MAG: hypothetical protein IPI49_19720 [Myxococcales bacterium]|nr:hypothetical protein [Myxococcales bacterium]
MSTPPSDGAHKALPDSPLTAALAALESLTGIVDQLSSLGDAGNDVRLAALAEQLRAVAQEILEQTGFSPEGAASGGSQDVAARAGKTSTDPVKEPADLAAAVAATKQTLAQVAALLAKSPSTSQPTASESSGSASAASPAGAAATGAASTAPASAAASSPSPSTVTSPPGAADALQKLLDSVQGLHAMVADQQQRLSRVEKQFGLPNSAPAAEQPGPRDDDEVGWPMDLNAPKNRQTVDKSVSFHDP